jgi:sugar phosphate isomerase/epimerase
VPLLDRYGVTLGIQNHCDRCVCNAMGLRSLIGRYEARHIAAVWDAAHNALNGEDPELAIDIIASHLCMVNLKNAFWQRKNGPEAEHAQWRPYWTTGRHGLASWPRVAAELKKRSYTGVLCLTAEYSDEPAVNRLIAEDLAFAKSLFGC